MISVCYLFRVGRTGYSAAEVAPILRLWDSYEKAFAFNYKQ